MTRENADQIEAWYRRSIKRKVGPFASTFEREWYSEKTLTCFSDYQLMRKEAHEGNERAQRYLAAFIAERMKG